MSAAPRVHALVLAAGESRRMGRPKLALPWGDTTVLGQVLDHLAASRVAGVVVVTGCDAATVAPIAAAHGIDQRYHAQWARGMTGSLQRGLAALPPAAEAALVVLGDQPAIGPALIDAVVAAFGEGRPAAVLPRHAGRRGHPVLFSRRLWPALLALAPDTPPRVLLAGLGASLRELEVGDPAVLADLDTPAAYRAALAAWRGS